MTKEFSTILEKVLTRSDIRSNKIPAIDLYIDQILTLLDQGLEDNKRSDKDKILTKTMINNYSKQKVIKPIKGKKYSKEHIIQMLMVYSMKNTLSIDEIKNILQPVYQKCDEDCDELCQIYDRFLDLKDEKKEVMAITVNQIIADENINLENETDRLVMVLCLCALSEFAKSVAQDLIETYNLD